MNQARQAADTGVAPEVSMLNIISGFWISRSVYVAAKLGIADLLKNGPKIAAELADATATHAPSLYRVLRALASVGVLSEDQYGRFANTPISETLCSDVPGSMRAFATTELGEEHYPAWGNLLYSVQTGGIAFEHTFGMDPWQFFAEHPDNAKTFNDAMSGMTAQANEAVLAKYDFTGIRKLVDVGGGHGSLITAILKKNPQMTGILFDSPQVIEGAHAFVAASGVVDRCELTAGDFFKAVPQGADAQVLKWIIHDWDDEKSLAILKNCHRALAERGKLILIEAVIPPGSEPHFGKFMDLNMLVMTGGRERTETEYRALYRAAGFLLTKIFPTDSPFSVIEGVRA